MGKLKNIQWKNIYYMICYCVEELEYFDDSEVDYEKVTGTHDLLAQLLVNSFEKILINGYTNRYTGEEIITDRPYGIINIEKSYQTGEYEQGRLICEISKYNENNYENQIIKAAFNLLLDANEKLDSPISDDLTVKLNRYRNKLNNVDNIKMTKEKVDKINIKQVERWYRPAIAVSKLIINDYIALDKDSETCLLHLNDQTRLCRIWEKFIRNLSKDILSGCSETFSVDKRSLEDSEPDFVVESNTHMLIGDAKWYEGEESVKSEFWKSLGYGQVFKRYNKNKKLSSIIILACSNKQTKYVDDKFSPRASDGDTKVRYWMSTHYINVNQDFECIKDDIKNMLIRYLYYDESPFSSGG